MPPKPLTVEAVLAASRAADAKLQALTPVFARLADSFGEAVKTLTPKPIKFTFDGFDVNRGKGSTALPMDATLSCRVRAETWNAALTIGFDRGFLFAMTEAMFGGSGEEQPYGEERPLSNIEKRIAKEMQGAAIRAMAASFQSVAETRFSILDETEPSAAPGQGNMPPPEIFARFLAHLWGYSGEILVGFPKSAMLMLQDKLCAPSPADAAPSRPVWNGQIRRQIADADVSLTAVLAEFDLPLDDLAQLKKGQAIKLATRLGQPVMLTSDGETLFNCALGQSQGRYVLSIDGPPSER